MWFTLLIVLERDVHIENMFTYFGRLISIRTQIRSHGSAVFRRTMTVFGGFIRCEVMNASDQSFHLKKQK